VFGPIVVWSFVGTGLYAWHRRPASRVGLLMLGPVLVALNGAVAVYLLALTQVDVTDSELAELKRLQVWGKLGPLFNPLYVGNAFTSAVGFAFLIVL
jgi:hypothetical protein